MRAFAVLVLTIGVFSVFGPEADGTPRRACNGLLAFASNRVENANPQIYAISLDGRRTNVSRNPLAVNETPVPSPDGAELAYWRGGSLVVSAADGSSPRLMVPPPGTFAISSTVAWAPDSNRLAVTQDAVNVGGQLVVVFDAATGVATSLGPGWGPQWSPDGSTIVFVGDDPTGAQTVFVSRPDGSDRRPVALGNAPIWSPDSTRLLIGGRSVRLGGGASVDTGALVGLAWTPDGSRIVGTIGSAVGSVAPDGTDLRVIADDVRLGRQVLSPDGRRVLIERPNGHVAVVDLSGRVLRDLGPWPPPPMTFWDPRWSPDGSKVLFWSGGKVIVADVSSGETRSLAGGPAEETEQPVWSADGSSIFDAINDTSANTDIYLAHPDGTGVRRVYGDTAPESGPAWSPDGKRLAFVRYGSVASLVVTDLQGHIRTLLRDARLGMPDQSRYSVLGVTGLGPPSWSADGRTIAVASKLGLELVDARSRKARGFGTTLDAYPAFSPDGRLIAFATPNRAGGEDIVVAPVNRGGRRPWRVHAGEVYSDQDQESGLVRNLTWSPDGRRLAFTRFARGEYGDFGHSTRTLDARTHRVVANSPSSGEAFHWSPDGRFVVEGGATTVITRTDGHPVAKLLGLRAADPSWQPLCQPPP